MIPTKLIAKDNCPVWIGELPAIEGSLDCPSQDQATKDEGESHLGKACTEHRVGRPRSFGSRWNDLATPKVAIQCATHAKYARSLARCVQRSASFTEAIGFVSSHC
jgi:hypothetical protein